MIQGGKRRAESYYEKESWDSMCPFLVSPGHLILWELEPQSPGLTDRAADKV